MMAQPSKASPYTPIRVIDSKYIEPHVLNLIVVTNSRRDLSILNSSNIILFNVKKSSTIIHDQLVLLDVNDRTIVTLREKFTTLHKRWCVFKGESKDDCKMIFSIKRGHTIQSGTYLHVFLANNPREEACDFYITGNWTNRNLSIYNGDSSRIIAKTHKMQANYKFLVEVYPNVDYAFVSILIAIIEAMKTSHHDARHAGKVTGEVLKEVGKFVVSGFIDIDLDD